jgi:NAD(P)-dependent dehydrogenase (short-subunit alcohol dehydrogenase family)
MKDQFSCKVVVVTASDGEDRIQCEHRGATPDWLEEAAARQSFGRPIDPTEVARAFAFLASGESGLLTGAIVNFDQLTWGAYDDSPHPIAAI